jgi:cell division protein FtsW
MKELILKYLKGDMVIWVITLLLLALSIVTVYSFVPILVKMEGSTPFHYLFKHLIYVLLGFACIFFIHRVDSKYISQIAKFGYFFAIALLLFTFFFGKEINGAGRWVQIPVIGLTFQSSDFAKLALFLHLSKLLVRKKDKLNDWKEGILPLMIPIVVICGLIFKDNLSTSLLLFALSMAVLFIGQVPLSKLFTMAGVGVGLLVLIIGIHSALPGLGILPRYETWKNRLSNKIETDQNVLENAQALDALKADSLFETYVSMAIGLHLLAQASINILVCTGVLPVTGQNMPFLAMGGSALIMASVSIGIIQSFAVKQNASKLNAEQDI